jgi:hypothetical protein
VAGRKASATALASTRNTRAAYGRSEMRG